MSRTFKSEAPVKVPFPIYLAAPSAGKVLGMSESWWWAQVKNGVAPPGIKFGPKATRWHIDEVLGVAEHFRKINEVQAAA
jgi:predicted DNA-binding transcriptional regulator AlpA